MRKLIFATNLTIDGCCDHTRFTPSDEMYEYFSQLLKEADLMVYGRKTFELMVPYWPEIARNQTGDSPAENEFAQLFDSLNKIVFSQTLNATEDKHTRIVRSNLQDEILRLKQETGKNISLGGVALPSQLIALGLVDEFHFVVHPVIAGEGTRLLYGANLPEKLTLKLVGSKTFASGCIALHYVKP